MNENEPPVIPYNRTAAAAVHRKRQRLDVVLVFLLSACCKRWWVLMLVGMIGAAAGDLETNPTYDKQTVRTTAAKMTSR